MADTTSTKSVLKLVATTSSKIRNLTIESGQLVFLYDIGRIAFDYKGTRVFYNQIVELETEAERQALENPLGGYYFVIDEACLWFYKDEWIQITEKPQEIVFIGVELPQLGQANKIYANITEGEESISVWSDELESYVVVADKTQSMTTEEVVSLFG
jgi:hypothetical protein